MFNLLFVLVIKVGLDSDEVYEFVLLLQINASTQVVMLMKVQYFK